MRATLLPLVLVALGAACAGGQERAGAAADSAVAAAAPAPATDTLAAAAPDTTAKPLEFVSSLARFQIGIPLVWGRRFSVSERAEPSEYPKATHVVEFLYLGQSGGTPPTILGIVAYDAAGWSAVKGGANRPKGDVVLEEGGRVFVATRQANPYDKGTPDALAFDSLQVTTEQVRAAFKAR